MVTCAMKMCNARSGRDNVRFFQIPIVVTNKGHFFRERTARRRALWLSRINRESLKEENVKSYTKLCSRHFISGHPASIHDENNPDWAPSLHLGNDYFPEKDHNYEGDLWKKRRIEPPDESTSEDSSSVTATASEGEEEDATFAAEDLCEPVLEDENLRPESECESWQQRSIKIEVHTEGFTKENVAFAAEDICEPVSYTGDEVSREENLRPESECESEQLINIKIEGEFDILTEENLTPESDGESLQQKYLKNVEECEILREENLRLKQECESWQQEYSKIEEECKIVKKNYSDHCINYVKLRNQLTEAECDKLDLESFCNATANDCQNFVEQLNSLQEQTDTAVQNAIEKDEVIHDLREKLQAAEIKLRNLQHQVNKSSQCTLSLECFKSDDKRVKYYTGLPSYAVFEVVLEHVNSFIHENHTRGLAPWQGLLLTLMRLHLPSLKLGDLAYRFNVPLAAASIVFHRWLNAMYEGLEPPLVNWPERKILLKMMKAYPKLNKYK